jgi:uncharacterized protein YdeI (YjbR/CyaY-like superfamily)
VDINRYNSTAFHGRWKLKISESLSLTDCQQFREWLAENHQIKKEIWLVIYKKSSGKPTISYNEAVEEALCFGWVDSMVKSIDAEKYVQRFTPRCRVSNWTEANKAKARRLIQEGKMTEAGKAVLPPDMEV